MNHVVGHIDTLLNGSLFGWIDSDLDGTVSVFVDGKQITDKKADLDRPDVVEAGFGSARGFKVSLETWLANQGSASIRCFVAGQELENSPYFVKRSADTEDIAIRRPKVTMAEGHLDGGKDVAILAIYTEQERLKRHQIDMIKALKGLRLDVVVVNSSSKPLELAEATSDLGAFYIARDGGGRDFGSWATALSYLGANLLQSGKLLFINDSIYPLKNFSQNIGFLMNSKSGVSALTDSYQNGYHLQSSAFAVDQDLILSRKFTFFDDFSYPMDKNCVIVEGELGFSRFLNSIGQEFDILIPYRECVRDFLAVSDDLIDICLSEISTTCGHKAEYNSQITSHFRYALQFYLNVKSDLIIGRPRNPQHTLWDLLIENYSYGFLKKELMLSNPEGVPFVRPGMISPLNEFDRKSITGYLKDCESEHFPWFLI